MEIVPIAVFRSPFKSKFGIPKQSGLVEDIEGDIVMLPEYGNPDFIRGIEGFDYIWLIWHFSNNKHPIASSVVRPPLLGGNEKVGVFATRSPFRPNPVGLSSVRLVSVERDEKRKRTVLKVSGADLQDGTPIFDIKPYIPYADSHESAKAGFADDNPIQKLTVIMPEEAVKCIEENDRQMLVKVLELDPRPHYHTDPTKIYGMPFMQYDIKFKVEEGVCTVLSCTLLDQRTF